MNAKEEPPPSPADVRKWVTRTFEILVSLWEKGLEDGCKDKDSWLRKDFWKAGNTLDAAISYLAMSDGSKADELITKSIDFFDITPYPTGHWRDDWGWWGNAFLNVVFKASFLRLNDATKNACLERAKIAWEVLMLSAHANATYIRLNPNRVPPYVGGGYAAWNDGGVESYLSAPESFGATPNTVTDLGFLLLSLGLASTVPAAEKGRYLEAAGRTVDWFYSFVPAKPNGGLLFNSKRLLRETPNPAAHLGWCSQDLDRAWSADQGTALYCFSQCLLVLGDGELKKKAESLREFVINGLVNALPTSKEGAMRTAGGVFVEFPSPSEAEGDHCNYNNNYSTGPGVFMRYIARRPAAWIDDKQLSPCIREVLIASTRAAWNNRVQKSDKNLVADSVRLWFTDGIPEETYGQYYDPEDALWPFVFQTDALDLFTAYLTLYPK